MQAIKKAVRVKILIGASTLIIPFSLFLIFLCAVTMLLSQGSSSNLEIDKGQLSATVEGYRAVVEAEAQKAGITGYENLILAIMETESGGVGLDPMQCSESPLNTRYPHMPNSITDPYYSIEIGIQYFASCLRAAHSTSPTDIERISLALQGYNYGNGYISWALERDGGYTAENAQAFSNMMQQKLGTSGYGNTKYVQRVLSYYQSSNEGKGEFIYPLNQGTYIITSKFGYRTDPINGGSELHGGVDFAAPEGTPIYASAAGTVIFAEFGRPPYGGYGYVVVIRHSSSVSTLYGHCSELLVTKDQPVRQGQQIARVGSTGNSTGNHCHFEIRVNNNRIDPMPYLQGNR